MICRKIQAYNLKTVNKLKAKAPAWKNVHSNTCRLIHSGRNIDIMVEDR
jgi:hypothetical protein